MGLVKIMCSLPFLHIDTLLTHTAATVHVAKYSCSTQGFFSKFLMGGLKNLWSPSVPDGDEIGWGGTSEKNPTEAKTTHQMQN